MLIVYLGQCPLEQCSFICAIVPYMQNQYVFLNSQISLAFTRFGGSSCLLACMRLKQCLNMQVSGAPWSLLFLDVSLSGALPVV